MTLEELKHNWNSIDVSSTDIGESVAGLESRIRLNETSAMRERIRRSSVILGVACVWMPFLFIPFWVMSHSLVIMAFVFFFILAAMHLYFARKVDRLDYGSMSATQALRATINLERLRERLRFVRIILACPLLVMLACVFYADDDPFIILGAACGAVVGFIIGFAINHRFVRAFRRMKSELESVEQETETE